MRSYAAILFLVGLVAVSGGSGPAFWSCAQGADHLKIDNINFSPSNPKKGDNVTISATGTTDETISGGTLHYEVSLSGIRIMSKTEDLCSLLRKANITCPVAAGSTTISYTSSPIPSYAPSGNYSAKAVAKDSTGAEITCLEGWFVLG